MGCLGTQDCCHEASDLILRVEDGFDGPGALFGEFVDTFPLNPGAFY